MDTCCLCFDDDYNLITPKHCSCKIKLHDKCLIILENNGFLCPICKKKEIVQRRRIRQLRHIFQNEGTFFERIIESPMALFELYPNVFTFLILFFFSIIFCFFILLPMFGIYYFWNLRLIIKIFVFGIPLGSFFGYIMLRQIITMYNI